VDFIVLEGWCVNLPLIEESQFSGIMSENDYVNTLFQKVDPEKKYFQDVLKQLEPYQKIWHLFDHHTCMLGGNIQWIEGWRKEQEEKLIALKGSGMTAEEIEAFVAPYIPFTWLYFHPETRAKIKIDSLLNIDQNHLPTGIQIKA
jgi:pantothenate kinase-related protein Tda10